MRGISKQKIRGRSTPAVPAHRHLRDSAAECRTCGSASPQSFPAAVRLLAGFCRYHEATVPSPDGSGMTRGRVYPPFGLGTVGGEDLNSQLLASHPEGGQRLLPGNAPAASGSPGWFWWHRRPCSSDSYNRSDPLAPNGDCHPAAQTPQTSPEAPEASDRYCAADAVPLAPHAAATSVAFPR
jgi:hypothetical protein